MEQKRFQYDQVYLLNLKDRPERLEHSKLQLEKAGIKSPLIWRSFQCASLQRDGMTSSQISCNLTHMSILRHAEAMNYESILVLEDDVVFADNFQDQIEVCLSNIPTDFDILYLGINETSFLATQGEVTGRINNYIIKPITFWGTHALWINKIGVQKLLDILHDVEVVIDNQIINHREKLNYYICYPSLVTQDRKNFRSDILRLEQLQNGSSNI